ncbi:MULTISPECIES: hypothetical protein [unclassified Streptomyces]|uniref:hypothetical protein n=1 Tax=unclassified Streptomyces TaxID=2593676 RepID=UPI002258F9FC|nr:MULTISPECIES: hypothetical protein [unclassified Streptomyces]MCX5142886.1 hypothetical protein [Streptomyces sp. NBC_00338]WRZ67308.1 hypothetical protein OG408_27010 [Streptomyces sp. NBC_01257]WSU61322.1 hypothetical protein OG450_27305 [Streptomyces sp. NBC_01104]
MSPAATPRSALRPGLPVLYVRSRGLPRTAAALAGVVLLAAWAAARLEDRFGHTGRVPVLVLAPLLVSAAIGTSLYAAADELDRTAVRRWWPRRLLHLLALTGPAAAALALAVPGHPEAFGAPGMIRNVLGATGVAAASAALTGARLSWLPMTVYGGAVYLAAPRTPGGAASVWAWPMQPGPQTGAWLVASAAYAAGAVLFAVRGPRPERG